MDQSTILPKPILTEFCRRRHIRYLTLFGSTVRGEDQPDSDMDLLVEFDAGYAPDFFLLAEIEQELSGLLGGRAIDLRTPGELSRYFRNQVLSASRVQYVA
ncbi:MAG: nucleotidyltransferase [Magnetococcales bacterium]|nr:nucleotidyltransferase [Magnetococcales bacterium]